MKQYTNLIWLYKSSFNQVIFQDLYICMCKDRLIITYLLFIFMPLKLSYMSLFDKTNSPILDMFFGVEIIKTVHKNDRDVSSIADA